MAADSPGAIPSREGVALCWFAPVPPTRFLASSAAMAGALGQRNLTPSAVRLLIGRRYNRAKNPFGGQAGNQSVIKMVMQDPATVRLIA